MALPSFRITASSLLGIDSTMFLKVLDVVHLQCPQLLDLLLELWQTSGFGVLEKFWRFEKFGTALEGGFLLASMVPPVLILERPHAVTLIRSQTEKFSS